MFPLEISQQANDAWRIPYRPQAMDYTVVPPSRSSAASSAVARTDCVPRLGEYRSAPPPLKRTPRDCVGRVVDDARMGGLLSDRVRRTGLAAVLLLVGSAVTAVVLARHYRLDTAATFVGLVGGVTGLTGLWLTWAGFKADRDEAAIGELDLAEIADQLAVAVRRQWEDEAAVRLLNDPFPLPVRWDSADAGLVDDWASLVRLATGGVGWPTLPPPGVWATGSAGLTGGGGDLAGILGRVPTGRLVILGEPGAGKTMLTVRLVLDLLAEGRRPPGGPVPVLLALASWNPREVSLYSWVEARLVADYPGLAVPAPGAARISRARALLDAGLIVLILDGLDEINTIVPGSAITRINDALRPGHRVVLTARTGDYRGAVSNASGPQVRLTGAAGIQLRPLTASVVADYLRASAGGPAGAARWEQLLTTWPAPIAQVLRTPLMVTLARTIYNPRPGEAVLAVDRSPVELLDRVRFGSSRAVEHHLFDAFIPAAYRHNPSRPCRWTAADAERWLVLLARHLEYTLHGTTDIAWWQLYKALSTKDRAFAAGFAGCLTAGLTLGLAGAIAVGFVGGLVGGLLGALVGGFAAASVVENPEDRPTRQVRWHVPHRSAIEARIGGGLVVGFIVGVVVGLANVFTRGLAVGSLAELAGALAGALMSVILAGLSTPDADLTESAGPTRVLYRDRVAASVWILIYLFVFTVVFTLVFGLAVGVGRGLTFGLACGLAVGLIAVVSGTAWGIFVLSRVWLAGRGELPLPLMAFLADTHEKRGVLRQVGPVYQFRHVELQRRLARR